MAIDRQRSRGNGTVATGSSTHPQDCDRFSFGLVCPANPDRRQRLGHRFDIDGFLFFDRIEFFHSQFRVDLNNGDFDDGVTIHGETSNKTAVVSTTNKVDARAGVVLHVSTQRSSVSSPASARRCRSGSPATSTASTR